MIQARTFRAALPLVLVLSGAAGATNLDFGLSYSSYVNTGLTGRLGLSDIPVGANRFSAAISNRAAELGVRRNLVIAGLGTARLGLNVAGVYAGQPGVRLNADLGGTLGPVALSASVGVWNTYAAALDPLSAWNQVALDPGIRGAQANLEGRYRVSRDLIATLSGELGAQSSGALVGEYRRGDLSYRLGARAGSGVLGAVLGGSYRAETFTVGVDALLGAKSGVTLSVDAPAAVSLDSERAIDLGGYLAYEPWRTVALPLRYGVDASLPLPIGPASDGTLKVGLRGGSGGVGAKVGYTFTLGGSQP